MSILSWATGCFSPRGRALSLYRRGMIKAKRDDSLGAISDYTAAIGFADLPKDVEAMLLYNRALAFVAIGDNQKGGSDLDSLLAMAEAPVNMKTMARQKLARMEARTEREAASASRR